MRHWQRVTRALAPDTILFHPVPSQMGHTSTAVSVMDVLAIESAPETAVLQVQTAVRLCTSCAVERRIVDVLGKTSGTSTGEERYPTGIQPIGCGPTVPYS